MPREAVSEEAAVVATVLDYFEGWFDGDPARMERALHPGLAKRSLADDAGTLDETTATWMVEATSRGVGKERDATVGGDRRIEVDVEDIHGDIANVSVFSAVYREYVQLVRTRDGWKIVNVLWQWTELT
jgi:hypothetical protein